MDTAMIYEDVRSEPSGQAQENAQRTVSEQLQTLNLYVYLDARRYGPAR